MRIKYGAPLLMSVLWLILACSDSSTGPGGAGSMRLKAFPTSVGSTWTYEWEDRSRHTFDTVIVRVAAVLDSSDGGPVTIWVFEHSDGPDTLFMVEGADTVRFGHQLQPDTWHTKFVFPLYVGAHWRGDDRTDSSWVPAQEPVSLPAGHFRSAFLVNEAWGIYNDYGSVSTWVVPEVGIVMEDRVTFPYPFKNYVRRLLDFEIADDKS